MSRQVFEKAIEEAEDLELAGSFPSAEEAVNFARNKYADLVILDIVMTEGMNGLSAAKRIKDIRPETKVIMVTSMPEVSYMERAIDLNDPVNAMVISGDDEVIETTMDDIEISIVLDLYKRNIVCTENGKQRAIRAFLENRVFWIF